MFRANSLTADRPVGESHPRTTTREQTVRTREFRIYLDPRRHRQEWGLTVSEAAELADRLAEYVPAPTTTLTYGFGTAQTPVGPDPQDPATIIEGLLPAHRQVRPVDHNPDETVDPLPWSWRTGTAAAFAAVAWAAILLDLWTGPLPMLFAVGSTGALIWCVLSWGSREEAVSVLADAAEVIDLPIDSPEGKALSEMTRIEKEIRRELTDHRVRLDVERTTADLELRDCSRTLALRLAHLAAIRDRRGDTPARLTHAYRVWHDAGRALGEQLALVERAVTELGMYRHHLSELHRQADSARHISDQRGTRDEIAALSQRHDLQVSADQAVRDLQTAHKQTLQRLVESRDSLLTAIATIEAVPTPATRD